ncbi:hypothetical protein GCM10010988_27260 [Cnuibacter physcomitrellae]|uniref:DUF5107 domain-containing protein n=1 Tax=Cnuibacter physcomitrellae TaxID=1619308 RepID=A0A1X9LQ63_9MICO|nr:DUF5107 domain-containing protein [Cnuibacter physcomitrellae]ARJ04030.1 hypothetical protein B5808_01375 [Cnuibacter physcomitrellae]GGI40073.1 hypothetical protein GCM10010988_27260 [Cnuibacter physcomitrellae]
MTADPTIAVPELAQLTLPDVPEELRADLEAGRPVAWSEPLTIRTYEAETPSEYPMYLDQRVYQGSSGRVYPLPFTERIADEAHDRQWQAIHLENRYVRLVVLPELGGRIHIGYDKTTGYDFFYRNNVIKPALVGLAGPWISGGVEFNWPQHHRPATYLPVETALERGDDGSMTVWCADHDPFTRMAAHHGVRLRPDSTVVELAVRLHNRTSERQTFLWWANVAARVHDDYQSFFPEDVRYVADHARRAITAFPAADRPYYGVDYPALAEAHPGADRIDWYRNIPVPTSYMIVDSQQDFFGGYDHAAGAGFVHWAERRLSPGKKQWTWGDAPFGHAWDAQLTDGDGPYVELMAGVYTDNQPDFSWLLPGETKVFTQHWFPIPAIGPARQATPDAAVGITTGAGVEALFAVTSPQPDAVVRILRGGEVVESRTVAMVPGVPVSVTAPTLSGDDPEVAAELVDASGHLLVRWAPTRTTDEEPWVATEPPAPEEIASVEELYLTGLHLEQFRHPTRSPLAYWEEALRRDPGDVRTNLALASREHRAGSYAAALARVELALDRLTRRNANPADAEAYYLAGLILTRLGRDEEAERHLGKAGWDGTWAAAAGYELAASLSRRGRLRAALRVLDTLDGVVGHDSRRAVLRAVLLRRSDRTAEADALLRAELVAEPLNVAVRVLLGQPVAEDAGLLLDVALELRACGADDALHLFLRAAAAAPTDAGNLGPVAHYLAAQLLDRRGDSDGAARERAAARASDLTRAFPSGLDAHDALVAALEVDEGDAVAHFLLGMLLYSSGRRADAQHHWEAALELGLRDPVLLRNAALAAYAVAHDDGTAWRRYEEARALAPADARLLYEQDQLAARLGQSPAERLARLEPLAEVVLRRDDLTIEYLGLLIAEGRAAEALEILLSRPFHPWEGGEGRALATWDAAREALGLPLADPPASLGEARPRYTAPAPVRDDGTTDYFATSLPELLLFTRESAGDGV